MKAYKDWSPTKHDIKGLGAEEYQDWLVLPVSTNRDADTLTRSNWRVACEMLDATVGWERLSFDHWACGWFEIIVIEPNSDSHAIALNIVKDLENYPLLSDDDHSELESEEADEVWKSCYSTSERIAYIKRHREQFEFRDMRDLMGCVRGKYFAGYASELLGG